MEDEVFKIGKITHGDSAERRAKRELLWELARETMLGGPNAPGSSPIAVTPDVVVSPKLIQGILSRRESDAVFKNLEANRKEKEEWTQQDRYAAEKAHAAIRSQRCHRRKQLSKTNVEKIRSK